MKGVIIIKLIIASLMIMLIPINPILSLSVGLLLCLFLFDEILIIPLIINCILINYYKLPYFGDYTIYYYYYHNIQDLFLQNKIEIKDYIFYLIMKLFSDNNLNYHYWAAFISILTYLLIYLTILKMNASTKIKSSYFLFFNPFFITRSYLAIALVNYSSVIKIKKLKKVIAIFAVLFHYSIVIVFIYKIFYKKLERIYQIFENLKLNEFFKIILVQAFGLVIGLIIKNFLIKVVSIINLPVIYFQGDFVFENSSFFEKIINVYTNYLIVYLPYLYLDKKHKYNYSLISFILLGLSSLLFRRFGGILAINLLILNLQILNIKKINNLLIYFYILSISILSYRGYLKFAYQTQTYPIKIERNIEMKMEERQE